MKKNLLAIVMCCVLLIGMTGCGGNNNGDNKIKNQVDSNNKVTNEENVSKNKYKSVNFGEKIPLDFVEITIDGASSSKEMKPDNPKSVYRYSQEQDGKTYFYLYGTIKNTSGEQYEFAQNMYVSFTFDGKYNYDGSITADEDGSFSYIYAYLEPLESEKFYIVASVPDELIESYQNVEVKFGFKDNFEYEYGIQEDQCDNLYSINIAK